MKKEKEGLTLSNRMKGAMHMVLAGLFLSGMSVFARLTGQLPTLEKTFFTNLVMLLITIGILVRNRPQLQFLRKGIKFTALRSVCGTLALVCSFYAIDRINLADADMLNKLGPFFAILFSALLLEEKAKPRQIFTAIIAFLGSLLIVKPTGNFSQLIPTLVAFLGGVFTGLTYTAVRGATTNGIDRTFVIFAYLLFSCIVMSVYLLFKFVYPTVQQMIYLLGCGLCGIGGQFSITTAYSYAPARDISIYDYAQVLFSAIWGFLFFQQVPDLLSFAGYAAIIGLALINFILEKKDSPQAEI